MFFRWQNAKVFAVAVLASVIGTPVNSSDASTWACRNLHLEVTCLSGVCKSNDGFTPMDVFIDGVGMTICAYSGCWEGKNSYNRNGQFHSYSSYDLTWNKDQNSETGFLLVIDDKQKNAVLIGDSYVNPMKCENRKRGN